MKLHLISVLAVMIVLTACESRQAKIERLAREEQQRIELKLQADCIFRTKQEHYSGAWIKRTMLTP